MIIGGGISGLAAALELVRNKISTTVLEAKNRFGGRIHTLRQSGVAIELGAEFIHGRSKPLLDAIHEAKLSTQTVAETNRTFADGKLQDSEIREIVSEVLHRVDAHQPDCSLDAFLARQPLDGHKRMLVEQFVTGFDAAHTDRISAHACLRAEHSAEQMELDQELRVAEGYSALVEYFVREIEARRGRLLKGSKVSQVRWQRGNVEVVAGHDSGNEVFRADAAIVTLPVGVLKSRRVLFEPSMADKIEAIDGLEFGNVVKTVFQFKESSWDDFGFIHVPGGSIPTWWSDARGPVITGWAGGTDADALLDVSTDRLCAMGLEILSKIVFRGAPVHDLRKRLLTTHYYNWANDPEIGGAYSYIPVNGLDLPRLLATPVAGTLFFAGEATVTDAQTGTVFGALESGQRAARELLAE